MQIKNFTTSQMCGLLQMADLFDPNPHVCGEAIGNLLTGKSDFILKCAIISTLRLPADTESLENSQVCGHLTRLKDMFRTALVSIIKKEAAKDAVLHFKNMSKPHTSGTVAELSQQLGCSKSEIRRMRAAGTLDEYIQTKKA